MDIITRFWSLSGPGEGTYSYVIAVVRANYGCQVDIITMFWSLREPGDFLTEQPKDFFVNNFGGGLAWLLSFYYSLEFR